MRKKRKKFITENKRERRKNMRDYLESHEQKKKEEKTRKDREKSVKKERQILS